MIIQLIKSNEVELFLLLEFCFENETDFATELADIKHCQHLQRHLTSMEQTKPRVCYAVFHLSSELGF